MRRITKKKMAVWIAALFAGSLAAPMLAFAQSKSGYDYTIIAYPGADRTEAFGLNKFGRITGSGVFLTDDGFDFVSYGFVYDSKSRTLTNLAPAAGYENTGVLGINDAGVMVG